MSIYDAVNRRNKGGAGTTSGSSSLSKKIGEANKQKKKRDRVRDASSFDLGSFGSDLASTSKSLYDYSSTWHSPEDMANARQGFENMYNRIGSYIDYTKKYGINNSQEFDFEGLRDVYGSVLSGWDDLTFDYGNYKNADEYNKAMKEATERDEYLSTVDVSELQAQLDDVNKQKKDAKTQLSSADYNFKKLDNGRNKPKYGVSPEAHNEAKTAYDGAKNAYFGLEENASNLQRDITLATRAQSLNALTAEAQKARGYDPEAGTAIAQGKMLADKATKETSESWNPGTNSSMTSYTDNAKDTKQLIEFGTDAEKEAYYYFLGTGQADKAKEYRDGLKESLNARKGRAWRKEADSYFEKLGVGAQAGLEQFVSGIEGALNFSGRYIPTKPSQYAAQEIRQELTQDANYLGRLGFDVVNTGANMLPSIAASAITGNPTIGAVTLGASAGGNSYQEMINQGYSQGQAYTYGILTGVSEAALQKVMGGIGALGGTSSKIATAVGSLKNGVAKFALRWGGSMASEGLEEAAQEILSPVFKSIATGEAVESVNWEEVAYSALLGGLLGVGEGVNIGANVIGENRTGKAIKGNERTGDVFDMASLSPEESQAYELYTRLADSGVSPDNISNAQLGSLSSQMAIDAQQTIKNKTATAEQKKAAQKALNDLNVYAQRSAGSKLSKKDIKDFSAGDTVSLIGSGLESGKDTEAYKLATEYKKKLVGDGHLDTKAVEASKTKLSSTEIRKLMDANASAIKSETVANETESEQKTKALARYNAGEVLTEAEYKLLNGAETLEVAQKEVESLSKAMDETSSKLFTELYDGKVNQERYAEDFTRVMFYATHNYSDDYILKNSGVITPAQVSKIVSETITNNARQREAAQKKAFEEMGGVFAHQADIDDSAVNYGDTPVKGKVNFNSLNMGQRNTIAFAMGLSRAMGTDLVIEPDNPKYNGKFSKSSRKIYINAYAGKVDGQPFKNALIPALSHETTHRMELESPALFRELSNIVFSTLEKRDGKSEAGRIAVEQARLDEESPKKNGKKHTEEEARSEIVARACEDMLSRSEKAIEMFSALTEEQQKGFVGTIRRIIADLKKAIRKLLATFKSDSYEAGILRDFEDELNKMQKIWDKMLENSVGANQVFKAQREADVFDNVGIRSDVEKNSQKDGETKANAGYNEDEIYARKGKFRPDYDWHTGLTKAQVLKVEEWLNNVGNPEEKSITDTAFWYKGRLAGQDLFVIYSTEDSSGATILYLQKGEKAKTELNTLLNYMEEIENGEGSVGKSAYVNWVSGGGWMQQTNGVRYSAASQRGTSGQNVGVLQGQSQSNTSGALWTVIDDLFGKQGEVIPDSKKASNSLKDSKGNTFDDDVQFSMKESVEETKELVAVHNLREEKLLKSLNLGGLPMPSIAIVRAREGHGDFGNISLVFNKETIDPKFFRSNKVYSGDAWTPTYPQIEYKLNEKAQNSIKKKIDALVPSEIQADLGGLHLDSTNLESELNRHGDMVTSYRYNSAMKYAFLKDNNINIELPTKEKPFYRYGEVSNHAVATFAHKLVDGLKTANSLLEQHSSKLMADTELINSIAEVLNEDVMSTVDKDSEMYQELVKNPPFKPDDIDLSTILGILEAARNYFHSYGKAKTNIDYRNAKEKIDDYFNSNALEQKYERWLKELFADIVEKEGIRNNKDLYTPSGNRRSFEALHYEHNLENVIRAMKEEGAKGIGGFGGGNIFGAATTEYGSIENIKTDAKNRLKQLPESQFQEIKKGFSDRFYELASSLPIHKDRFSAVDDAANMLIEAVLKYKTKSGISSYLRSESKGWANYSDYVVDDLIELVEDIRNMPVAYFEAKPQRVVGFDEVATAIIPDNASEELKTKLSEHNIPFVVYESGNDTARLDALNSLDDVQFSEKRTTSVYDLMGESKRLAEENKKLAADVELLKERLKLEKTVTHGKYAKSSTLLNAASVILGKAQSKYSKVDLAKRIGDVYTYIASDPDVSAQGIFDRLYPIAEDVLAEAKVEVEVDYAIKGLLKDLKKTRISLDNAQIAEMEYRFGKDWRKRFFNKIIIAEDGIPLDSKWQEWAETIPAYFDADLNSADQIGALYDLIDTLKEASERVIEYDNAEQARWLADEIYNQFWNITPYESTADKYEKKISELKSKHKQMMTELRQDYKEREKENLANRKERYQEIYKKLKERKQKEVAYAKELGKQKLSEYKENAEKKTRIQRITANALALNEYLVKNSKDKHINEDLKGPVIQLLTAIDFSSKRMLEGGEPTKQDERLSKALSKVKEMFANASNGKEGLNDLYGHGLDEDIEKMVKSVESIVDSLGGKDLTLNMMTLEDLQTLDKVMRTVKAAVNNVNKFHVAKHAEGIANLSRATMGYLNELGQAILHSGLRGKLDKLLNWNNALPYYVFKRYGVGGRVIFRALMDGQDKLAFNVKQIIDYAESTYTKDEIKKWDEEVKTFNIPVPKKKADSETEGQKSDDSAIEYQTIKMTVPQIMSLYCLAKRDQARKHLFAGGIRVADFETKKGGIVSQTGNVIFTEEGVAQILDSLTERQKEVADKLQEFLNTVCPEWGNEVSMARFGYKAFGEKNYFPIYSDKNNLAVDDESDKINSLFRLLNMSFTKPTDDNANNTIIVSNIFDVFAQHTSDMAKYNALALPVLDTFKWYNYNEKEEIVDGKHKAHSVKQSIETAFGKDGQSYLMTFLRDINGQQESDRESISKEFMRNFKIASVGMNLRVAALQPTSYLRAGAVIDNKYLVKAFAFKDKARGRAIDMAKKYCGIALWKSMGYYDTNIQRGVESQIKHDETWKDKAVEKSMYLAQKADEMTWGVLWNACELEIRDKRKDLEVGSEEFYETIGKRLREVIYATQVVDSVMTRSQMMRSTKGLDQFFTNFASEPTLGYNMLYDAYMSMALETRRTGSAKKAWEKYGKKIQRLAVSYTLTCAVTAAIEVAFDAFRNDDDEEKNLLLAWLTNFLSNMSITSKIPYIKELHSVIKGYRTSRSELAWAEDAWNAGNKIAKLVQGKGDFEKTLRACLKALSELTSLPGFSAYRDGYALIETIGDFIE